MNEEQKVINELQQYLRNIARVEPKLIKIIPDGIYGKETQNAVLRFQQLNNLEQTGTVNFDTWKKLVEENQKAIFILEKPIQTANITNKDLPLKLGDKNKYILTLKLMLNELAEEFSNFQTVIMSESFDTPTEKEVRRWQRVSNIPITGIVDKLTWNMLSENYLIREEI